MEDKLFGMARIPLIIMLVVECIIFFLVLKMVFQKLKLKFWLLDKRFNFLVSLIINCFAYNFNL
mgnify:CR=1 FL=1